MADVFISYAHADLDKNFAQELEDRLKIDGITVWRDKTAIENGTFWRSEIDQNLEASKLLVVIISPSSMKSAYVTYEWCYAWFKLGKHLEKGIYWIYLENSENKGMFGRLKDFQIPFDDCLAGSPTEGQFKTIISQIQKRVQGFEFVENAAKDLFIEGNERDALRPNYGLRNQWIDAVNRLGQAKGSDIPRARQYLHKGIEMLLSGELDGTVLLKIVQVLANIGDVTSIPYIWRVYRNEQMEQWQNPTSLPTIKSVIDKLSGLHTE